VTKIANLIFAQSAVLAYRLRDNVLEVLVITSREGKRWVLPKGMIEPGMTAAASAAKEAMEEAGITGRVIDRSLGRYHRKKWRGICEVEVFPMEVMQELKQWPESAFRRRAWVTLEEATKRLDPADLKKILGRLPAALADAPDGAPVYAAPGKGPRVLHLFRHAKSSWTDPRLADFDRPLAPRGKAASKAMGTYMKVADIRPDLVLSSSSARTRETLEMALPMLAGDASVTYERALYHAASDGLLKRLRRMPDKVDSALIVGHNPGLQALAVSLAGSGDPDGMARLETKFPTAGLATLILRRGHWRDLAPRSCELHSFVVPRDLMT